MFGSNCLQKKSVSTPVRPAEVNGDVQQQQNPFLTSYRTLKIVIKSLTDERRDDASAPRGGELSEDDLLPDDAPLGLR